MYCKIPPGATSRRNPTEIHMSDTANSNTTAVPGAVATAVATLGGGCFWCLEAVYDELAGVVSVESGYCNGHTVNPTYREVCEGDTGHAEVVEVTFDPAAIRYSDLLEVFWANHDPTTLNRQGPDWGSQYRSVIFYHSPEQEAEARRSREAAQKYFTRPIVTALEPAPTFWPAEEYHQQYLEKRGLSSCHL